VGAPRPSESDQRSRAQTIRIFMLMPRYLREGRGPV
jgi:hypothetical protein